MPVRPVAAGAPGDLIEAARRGDSAAQQRIFQDHRHSVARLAFRLTGDASIVDDLVQEVFISAFASLASFRGDARIETWLHTITVNKARNFWDSTQRRRRREYGASARTPDGPDTPEEELAVQEHRQQLYGALEQLPDKLRVAFVLRAIEGQSLQEAADVLGVPISTVSYRTRRAEERLCQILGLPGRPPRREGGSS